jgi:hypothetical protein
MERTMMKATCMGCDEIKECHQVQDVGWVCSDCRGNFAPPPHIIRQIERELIDEEQTPQPPQDTMSNAMTLQTMRRILTTSGMELFDLTEHELERILNLAKQHGDYRAAQVRQRQQRAISSRRKTLGKIP